MWQREPPQGTCGAVFYLSVQLLMMPIGRWQRRKESKGGRNQNSLVSPAEETTHSAALHAARS
eukprot:2501991-Alexandrium_andersonii.AAC.1